jgi:signal transduction histidine kinase
VAALVREVSAAVAVDAVLPELARATSRAVHQAHSEVRLWLADGSERRETWPPTPGSLDTELAVPLDHGGSTVGRLAVAAADGQDGDGRRALELLAGPAAVALSNVRLAFELRRRLAELSALSASLRRSRERLVAARAEQRRRLSAEIRAQVLPELQRVDELLAEGADDAPAAARPHAQEALDRLRELTHGVFPAVLAEQGLGPALELYGDGHPSVSVSVAPDVRTLGLPAEVAATAYFCGIAAPAALPDDVPVTVHVALGDAALVEVVTAGERIDAQTVQLIHDRAEAVGGRLEVRAPTSLSVTLPLATEVADLVPAQPRMMIR